MKSYKQWIIACLVTTVMGLLIGCNPNYNPNRVRIYYTDQRNCIPAIETKDCKGYIKPTTFSTIPLYRYWTDSSFNLTLADIEDMEKIVKDFFDSNPSLKEEILTKENIRLEDCWRIYSGLKDFDGQNLVSIKYFMCNQTPEWDEDLLTTVWEKCDFGIEINIDYDTHEIHTLYSIDNLVNGGYSWPPDEDDL